MPRKRKNVTDQDVDRWVAQWEESYQAGNYESWAKVRDVPSLGRATKVRGIKSERIHHLHSDIEYSVYLMLEYDKSVIEIYDQHPLLPRSRTVEIACEMGISPARYPCSKSYFVYSTDFVVVKRRKEGKQERIAITVKPKLAPSQKNIKRTLQKLEVERRFWNEQNIVYRCITNENINYNLIHNLKWFINDAIIDSETNEKLQPWLKAFTTECTNNKEKTLRELLENTGLNYESSVKVIAQKNLGKTIVHITIDSLLYELA